MKLHDYLDTLSTDTRKALAAAANIDDKYLAQLKSSSKKGRNRFPSLATCKVFIDFSQGKVTLEELRPDIYGAPLPTEAAA